MRRLLLLLATAGAVAAPSGASAAVVADLPPSTTSPPYASFITDGEMAQSFTAAASDSVDRVSVAISRWSGTGQGDLVVELRTPGVDGLPTGPVLASAVVAAADVPLAVASGMPASALYPGTSVEANFAAPVEVTAGERLFVVARVASPSLGGSYAWHPAAADAAGAEATYREAYFPAGFWFPLGGIGDLAITVGQASAPAWPFSGFEHPVDALPAVNAVKAGQAVPVRFSLGGDRGLDVFAPGYPRSREIACGSDDLVDGVEETVSPGSAALTYAAGTDRYQYVWKTDRAWSGQCRQLVVAFADGSVQRANFALR